MVTDREPSPVSRHDEFSLMLDFIQDTINIYYFLFEFRVSTKIKIPTSKISITKIAIYVDFPSQVCSKCVITTKMGYTIIAQTIIFKMFLNKYIPSFKGDKGRQGR